MLPVRSGGGEQVRAQTPMLDVRTAVQQRFLNIDFLSCACLVVLMLFTRCRKHSSYQVTATSVQSYLLAVRTCLKELVLVMNRLPSQFLPSISARIVYNICYILWYGISETSKAHGLLGEAYLFNLTQSIGEDVRWDLNRLCVESHVYKYVASLELNATSEVSRVSEASLTADGAGNIPAEKRYGYHHTIVSIWEYDHD